MKLVLEIPIGTVKAAKSVSYTERVFDIDDWKATLPPNTPLADLLTAKITRNSGELIRGRCFAPSREFSGAGLQLPISGKGYAGRLSQFDTGNETQTVKTVSQIIQAALDSSDGNHGITLGTVDSFFPVNVINEMDDFFSLAPGTFDDTFLKHRTDDQPTYDEILASTTVHIPPPLFPNYIWDGTRIFVFTDNGTSIFYNSYNPATDTWAGLTDTTYDLATARNLCVVYDGTDIFLTFEDADDDLRFQRWSISGAVLTEESNAEVVANFWLRCAPTLDDEGDLWLVALDNNLYESTDNGVSWNNRGNTGVGDDIVLGCIRYNTPPGTGDMIVMVYDDSENDVERWIWDKSVTTLIYVETIDSELNDKIDDGTIPIHHRSGRLSFLSIDGAGDLSWFYSDDDGVTWDTDNESPVTTDDWGIAPDGDKGILMAYAGPGNGKYKHVETGAEFSTSDDWTEFTAFEFGGGGKFGGCGNIDRRADMPPFLIGKPQGASAVQLLIMFEIRVAVDDADSTGEYTSQAIVAGGSFSRWGSLYGLYVEEDGITKTQVLDGADVLLVDNLTEYEDLYLAGVSSGETTIKIKFFLDHSVVEVFIDEFYVSERSTSLDTITYDNEPFNAFLSRLAKTVGGAEYDLNTDDTLDFVDELGTDESANFTFEQGVNCKSIKITPDANDYANVVKVIGATVDSVRVEQTVKNITEIADKGDEYWYIIRDPDVTTDALAINRAQIALNTLSTVPNRIAITGIDTDASTYIRRGNKVSIVDPKTDQNSTARIIDITRSWGPGGEVVSANLANAKTADGMVDYWAELEDLRRQLV